MTGSSGRCEANQSSRWSRQSRQVSDTFDGTNYSGIGMLSCWQVDVKLSIAMHLQITFGRSAFNRMYIGVNGFYSAFNVRVNTISQIA